MLRQRWLGMMLVVVLLGLTGAGCAPELSLTLNMKDRDLETLGEPISPTVTFRNVGAAPLFLPIGLIEPRRNLTRVIYRRWRGYPKRYRVYRGPYHKEEPAPLPPPLPTLSGGGATVSEPDGEADKASQPPYRSPLMNLIPPAILRLKPGDTYRLILPARPAADFVEAGADAAQIGIWSMRVFFNADYPDEGVERIRPAHRRNRLWRGVAVSNAVTINIADRQGKRGRSDREATEMP